MKLFWVSKSFNVIQNVAVLSRICHVYAPLTSIWVNMSRLRSNWASSGWVSILFGCSPWQVYLCLLKATRGGLNANFHISCWPPLVALTIFSIVISIDSLIIQKACKCVQIPCWTPLVPLIYRLHVFYYWQLEIFNMLSVYRSQMQEHFCQLSTITLQDIFGDFSIINLPPIIYQ